jgi:hypothetical protein
VLPDEVPALPDCDDDDFLSPEETLDEEPDPLPELSPELALAPESESESPEAES